MIAVETYEMTEVDSAGVAECDAESLALIESLGLEGQKQLTVKKESGDDVRMPYRLMTDDESFVYRLLMPTQTKLQRFNAEHVPLRVLQVAAHAVDLFETLEVWSAARADVKDPVLVGIRRNPESSWQNQTFILARWGDVLMPFADLAAKAVQLFREQTSARFAEIQADIGGRIAAIDAMPSSLAAAMKFRVPSYSGG